MKDKEIVEAGVYKHKNLTVYIKREYCKSKKLSDILSALAIQEISKKQCSNNALSA